MDDVLVFGRDQEEHKQRLEAALHRMQSAGVTLNLSKCEFSRLKLSFWATLRTKMELDLAQLKSKLFWSYQRLLM